MKPFPWWILLKAAGMAFAPTVLILATLASAGSWAGFSSTGLSWSSSVDVSAAIQTGENATSRIVRKTETILSNAKLRAFSQHSQNRLPRLPTPVRDLLHLLSTPWNPLATSTPVRWQFIPMHLVPLGLVDICNFHRTLRRPAAR